MNADEIRALPYGSWLYFPVLDGKIWMFRWLIAALVDVETVPNSSRDPEWMVARYGPATLVWAPAREDGL